MKSEFIIFFGLFGVALGSTACLYCSVATGNPVFSPTIGTLPPNNPNCTVTSFPGVNAVPCNSFCTEQLYLLDNPGSGIHSSVFVRDCADNFAPGRTLLNLGGNGQCYAITDTTVQGTHYTSRGHFCSGYFCNRNSVDGLSGVPVCTDPCTSNPCGNGQRCTNLNGFSYSCTLIPTTTPRTTPTPTPNQNACPRNIYTGSSGTISSPGWPGLYGNNLRCFYTITVPQPGSAVQLTFRSFSLEKGYDFLKIYDGAAINAGGLLASYTGYQPNPSSMTILSGGQTMNVLFTSDVSGVTTGFEASWSSASVCGQSVFTSETASIASPNFNYHVNYPNNLMCTYTIGIIPKLLAPAGLQVQLLFNKNSATQQSVDTVTVKQSSGNQLARYSGKFNQNGTAWFPVITTGSIQIIFQTNSQITGSGWSATYTIFGN